MKHRFSDQPFHTAGLLTLSMRLVIGWTYFSAFWRRLVLENKLTPGEAGYIGEKFNHFLPNALGIRPLIEYLVTHPDTLHTAMVIFTIVEAIVGLFLMLGLLTRTMSIGVMALALGILLGSGWLGTTCLDEWQIGVLGIAGGFTLFLSGSSTCSLDYYFLRKKPALLHQKWFSIMSSGSLPAALHKTTVAIISVMILGLTLYTNQYFHGGVWGQLHNKSVRPKISISHVNLGQSLLKFEVFRTEGADVYGSFLIGIQLLDEQGTILKELGGKELAALPPARIHNHYVARVKPGKHSLVIPLGAKADITLDIADIAPGQKIHTLKLVDISGIEWTAVL